MTEARIAWQAVRGHLQMEMDKASFDTWIKDTEFVAYEDGSLVIGVHNDYARGWLENRLTSTISRKMSGLMGRTVEVRFVVWQDTSKIEAINPDIAPLPIPAEPITPKNSLTLNSRYTFENFIVGTSNRLAHAASLAVAEAPANAYNPLFLYGGVGLGKTHLLHAIGNACVEAGLDVLYVSSEEFTNDLINSIRGKKTQAFRDKYRKTDVLLIDDIQFIAGKESTQEEFFHTFNTIYGMNKQVVISSDRSPKSMHTLEDRLRSRFEWGLIADIQPPDYETRIAILRTKAEKRGKDVPNDILEAIAQLMQSNIRELEGALNRILAHSDLRGIPLTIDLVQTALIDMLPQRKDVTPESVIEAVAKSLNVSVEQIKERNRSKSIVIPRQIAMFLLREETRISLPKIGEVLGGRDHTTVMYGCDKMAGMIEQDERLRKQVVDIRAELFGI
ncbi:MAG: chromosomal replication initiator protein DnaA [Deltaproteobacteria bacterium]|nr:chromosomal replication initiator protein DnaA [Deltaproteobacteria bacterium]